MATERQWRGVVMGRKRKPGVGDGSRRKPAGRGLGIGEMAVAGRGAISLAPLRARRGRRVSANFQDFSLPV